MNLDRANALRALIEYRLPVGPAIDALATCEWDVTEPQAWLTSSDVEKLLARHASGELTNEQVVEWADLLECREDIGVADAETYLNDIIFQLANPTINGSITLDIVQGIRTQIRRSQGLKTT